MRVRVFTRREVDDLADTLDSLDDVLGDDERALLVAIFGAARSAVVAVKPEDSGEPEPTAADLKEQLVNAFLPAEVNDFIMEFRSSISGEPIVHR